MENHKKKAVVSWSSGKDSAYAFFIAQKSREFDIVGILTTMTENRKKVSVHDVREQLLDLQAERLGLPLTKIAIPSPCSNEIYERRMDQALEHLKSDGVTHVIFGDLFWQMFVTIENNR